MKKGTAVCIVIMAASFVLSMMFLFISTGLYVISGTKELAERIRDNRWDDIDEKFDFVEVDKDEGVKVDVPGLHVIVDDLGVDVRVLGIHVDMRDDDENAENTTEEKGSSENKETAEASAASSVENGRRN